MAFPMAWWDAACRGKYIEYNSFCPPGYWTMMPELRPLLNYNYNCVIFTLHQIQEIHEAFKLLD
jgi:hypothetical protein